MSNAEQKLKTLLRTVAQQNGSDLHLVVARYPTMRLDGKLYPLSQDSMLTPEDTQALSDALLTESNKKKLIADGQVDFSYNFEGKIRFRTNVFFQKGYISIAMRLIPEKIRTLEELNMPVSLYDLMNFSQGLILITGPVGHGKSTTLSALIDYVNHNQEKNIITIEDPIESVHIQDRSIISQREIGQDAKSFSAALRAVFREDANVVMIGELRDLDTIATALTAAETGHLILGTLHTNDSAQTIDRIIDVFPSYQQNQMRCQLANVLLGVISQRLISKIGEGRVPAVEIMLKNHAVENLIRENKAYQIDNVIETSLKEGMISLDKALINLVQRGLITAEDAYIYAKNKDDFQNMVVRNK